MSQPRLFGGDRRKRPYVSKKQMAKVLKVLDGRGWIFRKDLEPLTDLPDRTLREIAALSRGRIISGQSGYKLTVQATDQEILECRGWLESQAKFMRLRSLEIRRRWKERDL